MWKCLGVNTSFEIKGMPLVSQKNLLIKTILSLKVHLGTYYAPQFQKKVSPFDSPRHSGVCCMANPICSGNTQLNDRDAFCYLVGPFVGLQKLAVEGGFVLHRVQAQEPTVVQGMVLRGFPNQVAQTFQLPGRKQKGIFRVRSGNHRCAILQGQQHAPNLFL